MYGFRLFLKRRAAEYKKTIGEGFDHGKPKEIIWNAMDPGSKMTASQQGKHAQPYEMLVAHIDERYRVTYGNTEFHAPKDDPMGIFASKVSVPSLLQL